MDTCLSNSFPELVDGNNNDWQLIWQIIKKVLSTYNYIYIIYIYIYIYIYMYVLNITLINKINALSA